MNETYIVLAALAGATVFIGLPLARWQAAPERLRGLLSLASAGLLLFLVIEVGYHAMDDVRGRVAVGSPGETLGAGLLLFAGFALGLISLTWLEQRHHHEKGEDSLRIATGMAAGIGLHSFAEGLAIGQSFSSGQPSLGILLLVGAALHNTLEGFGIAGTLTGRSLAWKQLFGLGLLAGGPTALGAILGGVWINSFFELLCLAVSTGSLVYVIRELLRQRHQMLSDVAAMTALCVGLLLGFATELVVANQHGRETTVWKESGHGRMKTNRGASLSLETLSGKQATLEQFQGKVVLLDVWATWCPPCVEALPQLQAVHDRYQDKGFTVVGVSLDSGGADTVRAFVARRNLTYPMLMDSRGANSTRNTLGVETLPALFLVDASGTIRQRWTGATSGTEIEAAVINALSNVK